ncbi:hypothetical protein JST97_24750 [bacterium]|nr:hypothetical protein [bacterium]
MAISNFTGAALEQQSAILDARAARSNMLSLDLMGKRLPAELAGGEAKFGANAISPEGAALLAPRDGALFGPEVAAPTAGLPSAGPNLAALSQNFLG